MLRQLVKKTNEISSVPAHEATIPPRYTLPIKSIEKMNEVEEFLDQAQENRDSFVSILIYLKIFVYFAVSIILDLVHSDACDT